MDYKLSHLLQYRLLYHIYYNIVEIIVKEDAIISVLYVYSSKQTDWRPISLKLVGESIGDKSAINRLLRHSLTKSTQMISDNISTHINNIILLFLNILLIRHTGLN